MKNLSEIGGSAFGHTAGTANYITATHLPEKLTILNDFAFLNCPRVNINDFTQLTQMGNGYKCLGDCGSSISTITIKASGISYGKDAFLEYAPNAIELYIQGSFGENINEELERIGLNRNWRVEEQTTE
jgi:hypothetical protein